MNEIIDDLEYQEVKEMGSGWHSYLQSNIAGYFRYEQRQKLLALTELSIEIDSKDYKPDVAIYSIQDKSKIILTHNDVIKTDLMPKCAIEIISPTQSINELISKIDFYFANQIESCWLVIPITKTIYVFNKSIDNQSVYLIHDQLKDEILDIEVNLTEFFD